jgi:exodeoxyribonuclease-3
MRIATWNVNSHTSESTWNACPTCCNGWPPIRSTCSASRRPSSPTINSRAEIEAAGYQVAFSGQKTYNGVAILSRHPLTDVVRNNPRFPDEQQR